MPTPKLDLNINVGQIIVILSIIASGVVGWVNLSNRVDTSWNRQLDYEASQSKADEKRDVRIDKLEVQGVDVGKDLSAMKTDIGYIRRWVEDVRRQAKITSPPEAFGDIN